MIDAKKVKRDSFDTMWAFLQMGGQKSNIPALKEHCGRPLAGARIEI